MALSVTAVPLDILSRKVGEALARAGEHLLRHEAVHIVHVDTQSAQVLISGKDYSTTVSVSLKSDGSVIPFCFSCRCFETYGRDFRWCAHKYAAALALVQHAEHGIMGNWQGYLTWLISAGAPARLPDPPTVAVPTAAISPTFLVLFSLQRQTGGQVSLAPLVVPVSHLPTAAFDDIEHLAGMVAQAGSKLDPQPMPSNANPAALAPTTPEHQAAMTALFAHPSVTGQRAIPADALYDLLPLLEHALVYLGTASNPLKRRLRVLPAPGTLRFQLAESSTGLTVTPEICLPDDTAIPVRKDKLYVLSSQAACCLSDDLLYTVPVAAEALKSLVSQPCPEIPADHRADFVQDYLAPLARAFPLRGEGFSCREFQAPPVPRLYLEDTTGGLKLRFRFAYGAWEFPRATSGADPVRLEVDPHTASLYRVTRDFTAEASALETLNAAGIIPSTFGERDDFTCEGSLARLLFDTIPALREQGFEVVGEEALRTIRVLREAPAISLQVSSKIDWFDLSGVLHIGELSLSLQELRRGLHAHEGYITCPDGSLIVLPPEWWRSLRFLLGMAAEEGGGLRVSRRQAMTFNLALTEFDQVKADAEFESCRQRLRAFSQIAQHPLPSGFHGVLRPYQQAGYDWLHFLHEYDLGGCLADDMGLGKTVQTLVFLHALRQSGHAQHADLLVMPRSLLFNWQREVERFVPSLRILVHADNDRQQDHADFNQYDLVLTTYGVMLRDLEVLRSYPFHYVILDEAQAIKNPQTHTSRAACCLNADHRLTLTGTPVENGAMELWSQFYFLNPGLLGSQEYFREEFSVPIEKQGETGAAQFLQRLVYPFILRRTKEQAAPDLPPRTERLVYNDMETAQLTLYEKTRDGYRERLLGLLNDEGIQHSRMYILEGLLRLRQLCLHPRLIEPDYAGESAKLIQVLDTLETLHTEGHKALVFSQFTSMLAIVREALDERGIRYAYLDGRTKDRQARVDAFQQEPDLPFFLISLKAGGTGLNLTAADYVLHLDPWWNPAVEQQATDRTHRIGQQKPVFVHKFITLNSVEEKIVQLQERKRALTEQLITTEAGLFKSLTTEDVAELFS